MDSPAISPRTNFATPRSQENVTAKTPLLIKTTAEKARAYHARIPGLRMLPAEVVWIITGVVVLNALVWAAVAVVLVSYSCDERKSRWLMIGIAF